MKITFQKGEKLYSRYISWEDAIKHIFTYRDVVIVNTNVYNETK